MGTTTLVRFIGIEGRVDPSIHNVGASLASGSADLVASESVACCLLYTSDAADEL